MYRKPPSDAQLAAFGFTRADFDADVLDIWPDNLLAVAAFKALRTQWRYMPGGMDRPAIPSGLDYASIDTVFRHVGIPAEAQPQVFADVQLMEVAALNEMRRENG